MGRGWITLLPVVLGGCFPPAVTVASFGADGASYAASGKTVTDHGMSALTMRDCRLLRIFSDSSPVCVREPVSPAVPLEDRRRPAPKYLVVVGSFAERGNADRAAERYTRYGATVVPVMVEGRALNRVVVGPVDAAQITALGAEGAWKVP